MPEVLVKLRGPTELCRLVLAEDYELRQVVGSGDPGLDSCWERLARFEPGNPEDLAALRRVWSETSPVAGGWSSVPAPEAVQPQARPRATAAHPRAYAGTKYKPPRQGAGRLDIRPFLERWDRVRRLLGLDEPNPYAVAHWGTEVVSIDGLDPRLREALPLFADHPELLPRIDRLVRRLSGDLPDRFLFVAGADPKALVHWLDALRLVPPEHRAFTAGQLAASPVVSVNETLVPAMARLAALARHGFRSRVRRLLEGLRAGASAAYLAGGLELELEFPAWWREEWTLAYAGESDVSSLVRAIVARLAPESAPSKPSENLPESFRHLAESLFDTLGALPWSEDFARDLLSAPEMRPDELRAWLAVPMFLRHERRSIQRAARAILPQAYERRRNLPEQWRAGYASRLLEGIFVTDGEAPERLEPLIEAAERMAPHSDGAMNVYAELLCGGIELPLVDPVLKALDASSQRRSQRVLLCAGLEALFASSPEFLQRRLHEHPRSLFRLASEIGASHPTRSRAAIARARTEALWSPPETVSALRRQYPELKALCSDVVPRSLALFLEGKRELSSGRQLGRLSKMRREWDGVREQLIRRAVELDLQRGITESPRPLSEPERHAVALLPRAGRHRRALKRVLRAALNGDPDGLLEHPATHAWFARHPRIDATQWMAGVEMAAEVEGLGTVRLAVETELLEVLKLGEYVRTCLALGGQFESDPAGIALDANKRVVYARDASGRVLARQLVALSEAEELVCYEVYAATSTGPLEDLFARYDQKLAEHLGLNIARHDNYEIALILSQHLWDDGRWEPTDDDG